MSMQSKMNGGVDPALRGLAHRIERSKVKVATLISKLEELDANRDGIVHVSDLEDILIDMLGPDAITKREMMHLARLLQSPGHEEGSIDYRRLHDVLEVAAPKKKAHFPPGTRNEHWYDPSEREDRRAALKRGSVGEWLQHGSCPAEVANFHRLIRLLEDYERDSGLKCIPTDTGFVIPVGPDLRANLSFNLSR